MIELESSPYIVFEYMYRDASNYKTFGEIWLRGGMTESQKLEFMQGFESEEFFIAEQIGIPALYHGLFEYSSGATSDDHGWHTFLGLRAELKLPIFVKIWGTAQIMLNTIKKINGRWEVGRSELFA